MKIAVAKAVPKLNPTLVDKLRRPFATPSLFSGDDDITEVLLGAIKAPSAIPIIIAIITRIQFFTSALTKTAPNTRESVMVPIPSVVIYFASILPDKYPEITASLVLLNPAGIENKEDKL